MQSARLMDLPEPDLRAWRAAIDTAVGQWTSSTAEDGALRLIYSRGRENGSAPTAYLTVNPVPARAVAARKTGFLPSCSTGVGRCRFGNDAVAAGGREDVVLCRQHGGVAACGTPRFR